MALIKCPECGKPISTLAPTCPNCGCSSSAWKSENKQKILPIFAGTTFQFGTYPYDASGSIKPINWHVFALSIDKRFAILYSEDIIDCRPYHESFSETNWDNSSIRYWLNNTFLKSAFSESEQAAMIAPFNKNPFSIDGHGGDLVFLPTAEDVINFFGNSNESKMCHVTPYAQANGAWTDSVTGCGAWWVNGCFGKYAQSVKPTGEFDPQTGLAVDYNDIGVRPVIVVSYTPDAGEKETGWGSMGLVYL